MMIYLDEAEKKVHSRQMLRSIPSLLKYFLSLDVPRIERAQSCCHLSLETPASFLGLHCLL